MAANWAHWGLMPKVVASMPAPVSASFQPPPQTYMVLPTGRMAVFRKPRMEGSSGSAAGGSWGAGGVGSVAGSVTGAVDGVLGLVRIVSESLGAVGAQAQQAIASMAAAAAETARFQIFIYAATCLFCHLVA